MTKFQHPVRVDSGTQAIFQPSPAITKNIAAPSGSFFLSFSPPVFAHAYALLGNSPQRFGSDLSLYLSTVRSFFERSPSAVTNHVSLAGLNTTSDSKKRLAEDLGVALSALFMVESFGVTWDTIAQIPQNNKLSKKRPDFEGFDSSGGRHLFEAKGTTNLGGVESALSKAIDQVKKYPEAALSKLAIVSYLSTDDRFFPSQTFVVDPPMLPDSIDPSRETAVLLHGEKVFQFAGLSQTSAVYLRSLSKHLKLENASPSAVPFAVKDEALRSAFLQELEQRSLVEQRFGNSIFLGRRLALPNSNHHVFLGVQRERLEAFTLMSPLATGETYSDGSGSVFPDGTCFLIGRDEALNEKS